VSGVVFRVEDKDEKCVALFLKMLRDQWERQMWM
jgi:hypothetical protein